MQARTHFPKPRQAAGFSLVEIMVALVIGMIGTIVMLQLFALGEGHKRATTGTSDAQSNGAIALYGLERDLRQAGYGVSDVKLLGCNLALPLAGAVAPALGRAATTLNNLAPLTINHASIPGGDANTDTLLVVFGNGNGSPQGDGITSQPAATQYAVQTASAFTGNDRVIAAPQTRATPCALSVDTVAGITSPNVTVSTGVANVAGGTLFNLGQAPSIRAYAVRGGNLTMCDHMLNDCTGAANVGNAAVWTPIASNIVSLRAEYGIDTTATMDGIVDAYNQTTPTTACGWAKTLAVRLALVARSGQYEKSAVTPAVPTWAGSASATPVAFDLSGTSSWQNYRYKVFETTVPIKNVVWMGVTAGC